MIPLEHFYVNSSQYPFLEGYCAFCADSTDDLLKYPPVSISKLVERVGPQIEAFYAKADPANVKKRFGKIRDITTPPELSSEGKRVFCITKMIDHYEKTLEHAVKGRWAPGDLPLEITMPIPEHLGILGQNIHKPKEALLSIKNGVYAGTG